MMTVAIRCFTVSVKLRTDWPARKYAHGEESQFYLVRSEPRSSSLILAMFAAMRRESLRFPERLRRLGLLK